MCCTPDYNVASVFASTMCRRAANKDLKKLTHEQKLLLLAAYLAARISPAQDGKAFGLCQPQPKRRRKLTKKRLLRVRQCLHPTSTVSSPELFAL